MNWIIFLSVLAVGGYFIGLMQGLYFGRYRERMKRADIAATALDYMSRANLPAPAVSKIFSCLLTDAKPERKAVSGRKAPTLGPSPE